jgi:hypothetical protein
MNRSDIIREMALRSFIKEAFDPNSSLKDFLDAQEAEAEAAARKSGVKNEKQINAIKSKARTDAGTAYTKAKSLHDQGLQDSNLLPYLRHLQSQGQDISTYGTKSTTNTQRQKFKDTVKARGISEQQAEELAKANFPDSSQGQLVSKAKIPKHLQDRYDKNYYDARYNEQKNQLGASTGTSRFFGTGIDDPTAHNERQTLTQDYGASGKRDKDIRSNELPGLLGADDARYSNLYNQLTPNEIKYTADPSTAAGQYGYVAPEELNAYLNDATRTSLPGLNMPRDKAVAELLPTVSRYTKAMSGGEGAEDDITREQLMQELAKDNNLSRQLYNPLMTDKTLTEQQRQSLLAEGAETIRRRRSDEAKRKQEAEQAKIPTFQDRLEGAGKARLNDMGNKLIDFITPASNQQAATATQAQTPQAPTDSKTQAPVAQPPQGAAAPTAGASQPPPTDYAYEAGNLLNNIYQGGSNAISSFKRGLGYKEPSNDQQAQAPAQQAQAPAQQAQAPAQQPQAPAQQAQAPESFQVGRLRGGYYDLAKQLSKQTGTSYSGAQLAKAFGNKMLRQGDKIDIGSLASNQAKLLNADISKRKSIPVKQKPATTMSSNATNNTVANAPVKTYQAIPETKLQLSSSLAPKANSGFSISSNSTNTVPAAQASPKPNTQTVQQPQFDEDLD